MQLLTNRVSRRALFCAVTDLLGAKRYHSTGVLQRHLEKLQRPAIPRDFVKCSALGFYRTSKFATGYTALQPKPLGSIIDVERVKDKAPEQIADIWDDVSFFHNF